LYCCYHTDNYKEAVLKAVNYGGDTDTNAIITGGLAALYYGYDDIPETWLEQIVKLNYIKDLCKEFYNSLTY
jgi:ADP-ribosylglycohydrolase